MYFTPAPSEGDIRPDPLLVTAIVASGVGVLVLGIVPTPLIDAAQRAVTSLSLG
jgi:hypothetical protein